MGDDYQRLGLREQFGQQLDMAVAHTVRSCISGLIGTEAVMIWITA